MLKKFEITTTYNGIHDITKSVKMAGRKWRERRNLYCV